MRFVTVTLAESVAEMDRLTSLWEQLLKLQPHSIFQRFAWNRLAAQVFADRLVPYVIAVESDCGAAIIPACVNRQTNSLELLGESLFDYRDVLHTGDTGVLHAAWQKLAESGLRLSVMAVEESAAHRRWKEIPLQSFANAPQVLAADKSEWEFRAAHPKLGRFFRRLERAGATFKVRSGLDSQVVRAIYEAKCNQFAGDPNNIFLDPMRRDFMLAATAREGSNCEVFTLETVEGKLVAALVTFRDRGTRRLYTIYFDPAWAQESPGVVLVYEVVARSLGQGLDCDFMTGEYAYKLRLATSSRALMKVDVSASELAERTQADKN